MGPIDRGLLLHSGRILLDQGMPQQDRQEEGCCGWSSPGLPGSSRYDFSKGFNFKHKKMGFLPTLVTAKTCQMLTNKNKGKQCPE